MTKQKGISCPFTGASRSGSRNGATRHRSQLNSQKFRKGVGGQRGLARGNPSYATDSGLLSVPFFLCPPPRRRGTHFWRTFWALFGGLFVANPLPPNPFSKPLTVLALFDDICRCLPRRRPTCTLFTIPFANVRWNVMRTILGKSAVYWPLMVLAEQWQCSLHANVFSVQNYVPTMSLQFLANGRVTKGQVPPIPTFCHAQRLLKSVWTLFADFC